MKHLTEDILGIIMSESDSADVGEHVYCSNCEDKKIKRQIAEESEWKKTENDDGSVEWECKWCQEYA